jgi:hypothetical protein
VGDGRGDAVVADGLGEADLEGVVAAEVAPVEASQDTAASAASIAIGSREGLRIG